MALPVVSVAVMHTPTASARVQNLVPLALQLPLATVVKDRGLGVWDTAMRAWQLGASSGATHHLVLQDDAKLCVSFYATTLSLVEKAPSACVSLFTPTPAIHRWIPPGTALVMPTSWINGFIAWAATQSVRQRRHDNVMLGRWLRLTRRSLMFATPSLVQHGELTSLLNHRARSAADFKTVALSYELRSTP